MVKVECKATTVKLHKGSLASADCKQNRSHHTLLRKEARLPQARLLPTHPWGVGYSLRSGGSQFTLTSQWESRNVRTSPRAMDAPKSRVRMSPSLFLVRTILTLENRAMYSSNLSFKCSRKKGENAQKAQNTLAAVAQGGLCTEESVGDESEFASSFLLSASRVEKLRSEAQRVFYFIISKLLHKRHILPFVRTLWKTLIHQSSPTLLLLASGH